MIGLRRYARWLSEFIEDISSPIAIEETSRLYQIRADNDGWTVALWHAVP